MATLSDGSPSIYAVMFELVRQSGRHGEFKTIEKACEAFLSSLALGGFLRAKMDWPMILEQESKLLLDILDAYAKRPGFFSAVAFLAKSMIGTRNLLDLVKEAECEARCWIVHVRDVQHIAGDPEYFNRAALLLGGRLYSERGPAPASPVVEFQRLMAPR
jgi:hypothetical protein